MKTFADKFEMDCRKYPSSEEKTAVSPASKSTTLQSSTRIWRLLANFPARFSDLWLVRIKVRQSGPVELGLLADFDLENGVCCQISQSSNGLISVRHRKILPSTDWAHECRTVGSRPSLERLLIRPWSNCPTMESSLKYSRTVCRPGHNTSFPALRKNLWSARIEMYYSGVQLEG